MGEYHCPRCKKELSDKEIQSKICLDCGCIFSVNTSKKTTKRYSSVITDSRKTNYLLWIKVFILFLLVWSIIEVGYIVYAAAMLHGNPWFIPSLVFSILIYIILFSMTQFMINVIRDVYMLRIKNGIEKIDENKEEIDNKSQK